MRLHRLLPGLLLGGVIVTTGCEELLNVNGDELLDVRCEEGVEERLVGLWTATFYDWGEGDVIAQGWTFEVELFEDQDGRLEERRPEDGGEVVTDSAATRWLACDGKLAIVIEEQWIQSSTGGFGDIVFDYELTDGGVTLTADGSTLVLTGGSDPAPSNELDPDLLGLWTATSKVVTSQDGSRTVDLIADEGHSMQVTFFDDGTFRERYTEAEQEEQFEGFWTADGAVLMLMAQPDGQPLETLSYSVEGDAANVTDAEAVHDFGDGEEPVSIEYTFVR